MEIHIDRHGKRMGPYSIEEASELLWKQTLRDTDLAWREGMGEWEPLPSLLSSIHPTLTAAETAPPEVETYGDLRKPKDPEDPTAVFVPAGPGKGETYGDLSKTKINPFAIKYELSLRVLFNVWGFVFLLLFFGAHRPVINFASSWLAGDVEGHWWGENEFIKIEERKIKKEEEKLFNETITSKKKIIEKDIRDLRNSIEKYELKDQKRIKIHTFNSGQFSVVQFENSTQFNFLREPTDEMADNRKLILEGSYSIHRNKIMYKRKRSDDKLRIGNPEESKMFWYYKVSDGGKRLLLSTSPDFLEPIILKKSANQFP